MEEIKKQVNAKYLDFNKNDENNLFGNMIIIKIIFQINIKDKIEI